MSCELGLLMTLNLFQHLTGLHDKMPICMGMIAIWDLYLQTKKAAVSRFFKM